MHYDILSYYLSYMKPLKNTTNISTGLTLFHYFKKTPSDFQLLYHFDRKNEIKRRQQVKQNALYKNDDSVNQTVAKYNIVFFNFQLTFAIWTRALVECFNIQFTYDHENCDLITPLFEQFIFNTLICRRPSWDMVYKYPKH